MNKLELKHLAPYLSYGLQVLTGDGIGKIIGVPDMIINGDVIKVHFGKNLKKKKFDFGYGGSEYNKPANFGYYYINRIVLQNVLDKNDVLDFSDSRAIPILYPLSDLVKPCLPEGKIPFTRWYPNYPNFSFYEEIAADFIERIKNDKEHLTLGDWNWLFEHHFDLHDLIEQNLAIDINTLQK